MSSKFGEYYFNTSWQGLLFDREEEYEKFISTLENTREKNTHVYNNLGVAYAELGISEMVLPTLAKAIEIDPSNDIAYIHIAEFHSRYTKDFVLSESNYIRAIKISPTKAGHYIRRAEMYMKQGKPELAYNDYKHSFKLYPKNKFVLNEIRKLEHTLSIKPEDIVRVKKSWMDWFRK